MVDFAIDVVVRPDKAKRGTKEVERSLNNVNAAAERTNKLISRAFTGVGTGLIVRALGNLANTFVTLQNQVKVATDGVGDVGDSLDTLFDIANRARVPIEGTVQLFQRLSFAAGEIGASQQDLFKFVETVSQALAVQGGSASAASGALLQLSQAVGSGIVRAEEFNSILEGAFPIALAAARGIDEAGGSVAKLRSLIVEGKITSEQFFRGLLSQSDEIAKTFSQTNSTIAQAFSVLRNNLVATVGEIDKSAGVTNAIASAILSVANNIGGLVDSIKVLGITLAVVFAPQILAAVGNLKILVTSLNAARVAFLTFSAALAIGGLPALLPVLASLGALIGGVLVVGLVALGAAAFVAQDAFVKFFNFLGLDGEKVLLSFVALVEGTVATAVGLFKGFVEVIKGVFNAVQIFLFKTDDAIKQRIGKRADPADFGLTPEAAVRGGRSVAENFNRGFEQGSQGFGLVDKLVASRGPGVKFNPVDVNGETTKSLSNVTDAAKKAEEVFKRQQKLLESIKGPQLNYNETINDLNTLLARGAINQEEYRNKLRDLNLEILSVDRTLQGGLKRGLLEIEDRFGDVASVAENTLVNAFQSAEDALVEFATTGKLEFGDLVDSILEDVARLVIRQQITGPLAQGFSDLFGGGTGGGGIGDFIGSLFGGFRAGGGDVEGGKSYIVGEKGPELFNPGRSGSITPNNALGGDVYINIINNTPSQVRVQENVDGNQKSIEVMIDESTARNINNPGSATSSALKGTLSREKTRR